MAQQQHTPEPTMNVTSLVPSREHTLPVTQMPSDEPCKICHIRESKFSTTLDLDLLVMSSKAGCAGCGLLQIVLEPHRNFGRARLDGMEKTLELLLTHSRSDDTPSIGLRLSVAAREGKRCPWPNIAQLPKNFGIDDPAVAECRIKKWLLQCKMTHGLCSASVTQVQPHLPTRVLEIQGPNTARLHVQGKLKKRGKYACLSYCWGGTVPLRTTTHNICDFQRIGIPWNALPLSFQDAVNITHRLGLRYFWIDSLCILQDDVQDWRHEGGKMAEIYSGSYITLAATGASNSTAGLYRNMLIDHSAKNDHRVCSLQNPRDPSEPFEIIAGEQVVPYYGEFVYGRLPLLKRAWAFQERLLSPRTVHFTDDMLRWECLELLTCELNVTLNGFQVLDKAALMVPRAHDPTRTESHTNDRTRHHEPPRSFMKQRVRTNWYIIVSQYTKCELTFSKDVLPALQGIAKHVQGERQCAYYAGLWEDTLISDLLWIVHIRDPIKPREYRAPSWSWASAGGYVNWLSVLDIELRNEASIISVETTPAGDDPLGEVTAGMLKLKGLCLAATVQTSSLVVKSRKEPIKLRWERDHICSTAMDQNVTIVLLATYSFKELYLVLTQMDISSRTWERPGLAQRFKSKDCKRYDLFEDTILDHHDNNQD